MLLVYRRCVLKDKLDVTSTPRQTWHITPEENWLVSVVSHNSETSSPFWQYRCFIWPHVYVRMIFTPWIVVQTFHLCTSAHGPDWDTIYCHILDSRARIQSGCVEIWLVILLCTTQRCHLSQLVPRPSLSLSLSTAHSFEPYQIWVVFLQLLHSAFTTFISWQYAANYSRAIVSSPVGLVSHTHQIPPTQLWGNHSQYRVTHGMAHQRLFNARDFCLCIQKPKRRMNKLQFHSSSLQL